MHLLARTIKCWLCMTWEITSISGKQKQVKHQAKHQAKQSQVKHQTKRELFTFWLRAIHWL
jgi:hypothetical protein